jgi:NADPH-dependent 2,4-dienoyl-CoA reductase/sulfur reductase-like enzyme
MASSYDYDLFVIGAGSGGVRAARMAAMAGARVAVAEEYRVGGACVIRGCVPKKLMVYASDFARQFETARGYGWTVDKPVFDWPTFLAAKDREIARLSGIYTTNLEKAGVDIIRAKAAFVDAHTLELVGQDRTITAEKILIATGGRPVMPALEGIEHAISSDQAFHRRRRLYRGGVRRYFPWLGRRHHPGLSRLQSSARVRRGCARPPGRGVGGARVEGDARLPAHPDRAGGERPDQPSVGQSEDRI